VRLLATLVRDPHLVPVTDAAGVVTERVFPVRVQAWETATALQADLPEPLLRE
jgi:hypothetical protein